MIFLNKPFNGTIAVTRNDFHLHCVYLFVKHFQHLATTVTPEFRLAQGSNRGNLVLVGLEPMTFRSLDLSHSG